MDVIAKARRLEQRIAGRFEQAAKGLAGSAPREPLEIVHDIVAAVELEIQPAGRGARVFPFNDISVTVLAPSPEARGRLEAALAGATPLRTRILERLQASSCSAPDLQVEIAYVAEAAAGWRTPDVDIRFARRDDRAIAAPTSAADPPRVEVAVVHGTAERRYYSFVAARIDIGRCAEVRDSRQRLIRTNHVVFTDAAGDSNLTVSRRHAHLTCDAETGEVRAYDDDSAHGTGIVRDGRTMVVPRGSRGVRLRSGDEIVIGEARLRVRISDRRD
jgi:hypothetical protein